ncbi:PepSY domain-containing protein [Streptomyces sp. CAU 1734]|uniref:PepSY domain-containing protein n=1 Tax=Streptomyces sp. CAU 1734 TaxID=3140360 RepID=UPI003260A2BC
MRARAGGARSLRVRAAAVVCAVAAAVPAVAGCGAEKGGSVVSAADAGREAGARAVSATPSAGASLSRERARREALVRSAEVGWEKAAGTATGEVAGSELVELDLGRADRDTGPSPSPSPTPGAPLWTATVALKDGTAHLVTIDAVTGKVLASRPEPDQDTGDRRELAGLLDRAARTPRQAADAATEKFPGTVTGLQLDENDAGNTSTVVWETEVADTGDWTEADITVDAVSGKVLRERVDRG